MSCALLAFSNSPSLAEEKERPSYNYQETSYDVYAGGINVVRADMKLDFMKKKHYSMFFSAETKGFLGALVPWSGSFESRGWAFRDGSRVPEIHQSIAMWRDEKETKTYDYGKDGRFKGLTELYTGKKPRKVKYDEDLVKDTTDALTATILVMEKVSDGGNCEGESEVFDGRRRYKLIFHHQGFVTLKKTRYNAYGGLAVECTVEVQPVAGAWHKKPRGWLSIQEQGRDRGMMPTVWLAQVVENAVVVPVRVRVKTDYGTLFMHMTKYKSGDTVLKAGR